MNNKLLWILAGFLWTGCRTITGMDELKNSISKTLDQQQGSFAVAFKDLQSGDSLFIRPHEVFHAASTMKTAVLIEVFHQVEEGRLLLDDSVPVRNRFRSIVDGSIYSLDSADDSEKDLYTRVGQKQQLRDLLKAMITRSSNLATNIIVDTVKADSIMATIRALGTRDMQVLRGVEDQKAFDKGMNNTTTAYDLMILFEKIARGEAVSPRASAAMIDILLGQHFDSIIPADLPAGVRVAHKTGSITGVQHDSGIVFLPDGRKYVLVLLSKDLKDVNAATSAMARVSFLIYQYVSKRGGAASIKK